MPEETKCLVDLILKLLAMVGAVVAFIHTMQQWSTSQRWKRMEKLDDLIAYFERDSMLRVARMSLDWTRRTIKHDGRELTITNSDALLALRDHRGLPENFRFEGEQPIIRDGYDAFVSFMVRVEIALTGGLIDRDPTRAYFSYWVERFVTMDRHLDDGGKLLDGHRPRDLALGYIDVYGDRQSMKRLCDSMGLPFCG